MKNRHRTWSPLAFALLIALAPAAVPAQEEAAQSEEERWEEIGQRWQKWGEQFARSFENLDWESHQEGWEEHGEKWQEWGEQVAASFQESFEKGEWETWEEQFDDAHLNGLDEADRERFRTLVREFRGSFGDAVDGIDWEAFVEALTAFAKQIGELASLTADGVAGAGWGEFADLVSETVQEAFEGAEEAVERAAEEAEEAAGEAADEAEDAAEGAVEEIDA